MADGLKARAIQRALRLVDGGASIEFALTDAYNSGRRSEMMRGPSAYGESDAKRVELVRGPSGAKLHLTPYTEETSDTEPYPWVMTEETVVS